MTLTTDHDALLSGPPVEELDGGEAVHEVVVPSSDDHVPVGLLEKETVIRISFFNISPAWV